MLRVTRRFSIAVPSEGPNTASTEDKISSSAITKKSFENNVVKDGTDPNLPDRNNVTLRTDKLRRLSVVPPVTSISSHKFIQGDFEIAKGSEINSERNNNEKSTDASMNVMSMEPIKILLFDSFWGNRVKAFENMNTQLAQCLSFTDQHNTKVDDEKVHIPRSNIPVKQFIESSLSHLDDGHHKVAYAAFEILGKSIQAGQALGIVESQLGSIVLAVINRLSDRRQKIKDLSAELLNLIRKTVPPIEIITAVSPCMLEFSERVKTVMFQFLAAIAPLCGDYFKQISPTYAFLNRLAQALSPSFGTKVTASATVAGQQLLELVFHSSPQVRLQ